MEMGFFSREESNNLFLPFFSFPFPLLFVFLEMKQEMECVSINSIITCPLSKSTLYTSLFIFM